MTDNADIEPLEALKMQHSQFEKLLVIDFVVAPQLESLRLFVWVLHIPINYYLAAGSLLMMR